MTFFHAPTAVSLAIGVTLTVVDLFVAHQVALGRALAEFDTIRLRNGQTLLEALESADRVLIRRDAFGTHIERRFGLTTIARSAVELLQQDLRERVVAPLSNKRLKPTAPFLNGGRPFVYSRN